MEFQIKQKSRRHVLSRTLCTHTRPRSRRQRPSRASNIHKLLPGSALATMHTVDVSVSAALSPGEIFEAYLEIEIDRYATICLSIDR